MRIGLSGTQSTGKTTLLNVLRSEKHFKEYQVNDEVTRWVRSLGIDINEAGSDISQEKENVLFSNTVMIFFIEIQI